MLRPYPEPLVDETAITAIRCSVRSAIRRRWFTPREFDDLVQDAVVHLLTKVDCFDPRRASWSTFCSIVVRSFLSRRRERKSNQKKPESIDEPADRHSSSLAGQIEEQHCVGKRFQKLRPQQEWIELVEDVACLLESLPDELRELCELLKSEDGIAEIADQLGVSRNTIYRRRRRIRECIHFEYMAEYR